MQYLYFFRLGVNDRAQAFLGQREYASEYSRQSPETEGRTTTVYQQINTLRYLRCRPKHTKTSYSEQINVLKTMQTYDQTAASIIEAFDHIPLKYPKYVTPFAWYLSSSTIM